MTELRTKTIDKSVTVDGRSGPVRVVEYQPGNGTRYVLTIVQLDGLPGPARQAIGMSEGGWTVTVGRYKGVIHVGPGAYLSSNAIRHWIDCSVFDGVVLAEIIGHLLGVPHVTCEQFAAQHP